MYPNNMRNNKQNAAQNPAQNPAQNRAQNRAQNQVQNSEQNVYNTIDYGPEPFVVNIDMVTKHNPNYRVVLWTGEYLQLTLMSIPPGGDIGLEIHTDEDQFIRVEDGIGVIQMGSSKDKLNYQRNVDGRFAILVPAGTWHNLINMGNKPLKVYSVYAPAHHPKGAVHSTKQEAEEAEKHYYQ
ncbi:cupin domain protein [Anaerotignum neopropionicum]|uniref:Cupin domain protein n=1 Tax=Anaerotignum neopropionicum TaxID=36847 RepID=A0A136WI01_9FIRM|nr:cupin domain-containing protein [Anaerotignum neopropionicum]KXL54198.1 cupin domain protein [Anaerotignum neopropionicum]KXL54323.1 cupin domain protein [Anaerotignum neopropionicum]